MKKQASLLFILVVLFLGFYVFCHSIPERSIRTYLFFDGHVIDSIRAEVFIGRDDMQYGKQYSTKNPGIGPDFISVNRGVFGLWFVDLKNSGGG